MAFYGYHGDDLGKCYWTPYSTCDYDYSVVSSESSVAYSSAYEFEETKVVDHTPYSYIDSSAAQEVPNYFVYNYTEPRVIQYEPPSYASASFYSQTYYNISKSNVVFDEPSFEEYDPTPYGGGYDIAQTYGNPLPPSDEICYPRSTPQMNAQVPDGLSYGSIPSPYGGDENHSVKPHRDKDSKPLDNKEQQKDGDDGDKVIDEGGKSSDVDNHPSSDQHEGFEDGETRGGDGYEWNKQVPYYTPYGSGLEAMDICESIFGYWPCLAKMSRQRNANCQVCNEERQNEPWKSTADYLFGSPFVYGDQKDGGNGYHSYGNESYYQYHTQYPYQ